MTALGPNCIVRFLFVFVFLMLSGCGQKGDLYLPEADESATLSKETVHTAESSSTN